MRYDRITIGEGEEVIVEVNDEPLEGEVDMIFGVGITPHIYVIFVYDISDTIIFKPRDVHFG